MAAPSADETIIVVVGGDPIAARHVTELPHHALVIAADSGIDRALAVGLRVDIAVGDFDSATADALRTVTQAGAIIERHPETKDETDLELAIDAAVARGARRVHVVGGHGGRLDHLLGNALVLASPKYWGLDLVAQIGDALLTVVRGSATLAGHEGDLVTLLAMHGTAVGVTTSGLRYALDNEDLLPGSTRGLSNQFIEPVAEVHLSAGTILAVQPTT